MKHAMLIIFSAASFLASVPTFSKGDNMTDNSSNKQNRDAINDATTNKMRIKIGSKTFTATLFNNLTASAFKAMLPLTLRMKELNGNEKFFHLSTDLPTDASNPETIRSGDLMLWRSNSVVLFYKTFSTSYSYTKLGRIDDATGLANAVGSGNVTVSFELE